MEEVILVSPQDEEMGYMEKMEAHQLGLLHRAFSVFLFNSKGEMLLQKRAISKYHSGGLWTNACCSHPRKGETIEQAASRRTREELGCEPELQKIHTFIYKAALDNNLTEHEFDHVLVGNYEGEMNLNVNEVSEIVYLPIQQIRQEMNEQPDKFTVWFKIIFEEVISLLQLRAL
ncbi:MAG: isopentenyl-diphosphate Delta-isomerase [Chitinophagaceae bacterium]|nr:isopentenyl-diphosphate Delta-isomerase [Chitinophagaceae bacterium]